MMLSLRKGRYVARIAEAAKDVRRAQQLRHLVFFTSRPGTAPRPGGLDADQFDAVCQHVLIEDAESGALVGCFRLLPMDSADAVARSYSAQFYDLSPLRAFAGHMVEMGRFCTHPEWRDPEILRLLWTVMAAYVDECGVDLLFGCSSFEGTDPMRHSAAFALLGRSYLAPEQWRPCRKAADVMTIAGPVQPAGNVPDSSVDAKARRAFLTIPPMLRGYLILGGWVSDHAVIDPDLGTTHVFTGLEIRAIPPARKRVLRATVAG